MEFYMYIIFSSKLDKFYVGSTNDVMRRLADHNRGKSGFTRTGIPWVLKYSEKFNDRTSAVRREMEVKKRKERKYIELLIEKNGSEHPGP
jgi:putative endonuclease